MLPYDNAEFHVMSSNPKTTAETKAALVVTGLSSSYQNRTVLEKIDFSVEEREIFVIMGASGTGKTTLLRHILGLDVPDTGRISLLGRQLSPSTRKTVFELRK